MGGRNPTRRIASEDRHGHLHTSTPMWVTIALPAEADLIAANRGADRPQIRASLQLLHGPVHLAKLDATPARAPTLEELGIGISQPP
eukprot:1522037-Pyramimonas_sp.AAC.1